MAHESKTGVLAARNLVTVVGASEADRSYAVSLAKALEAIGIATWCAETDVLPGQSTVEETDRALTKSIALVLVRSSSTPEAWSTLQIHAFQTQVRISGHLKIIIVPRGSPIIDPSILAQAVCLAPDLDVRMAATLCRTVIVSNRRISSFQIDRPRDNRNAPLLHAGAWSQVPDLEQTYPSYVDAITDLIRLNEYEHAKDLYWHVLYYSGYRELWNDRLDLSKGLLQLAWKSNDLYSVGLILSKGIAYTFLSLDEPAEAYEALKKAYVPFVESHDYRGRAICWDYLADIYVQRKQHNLVLSAYSEAFMLLNGLEKHRIHLKRWLYSTIQSEMTSAERLDRLTKIRDEFASMHDYREALVEIEIAKHLDSVGASSEAIVHAQSATRFLEDTIKMPRNAVKARETLLQIQGKR